MRRLRPFQVAAQESGFLHSRGTEDDTVLGLSRRHFIAIKLDITERKLSEERICRLAQVVENSAEMIAIGDPEGRIVFVNRAMLQATGQPRFYVLDEDIMYLEQELVSLNTKRSSVATI